MSWSGLVGLLRCGDCDYDECNSCLGRMDELGEDSCVCCRCENEAEEFAEETRGSVGTEMNDQKDVVEDSKFVDQDEIDLGLQEHPIFTSCPKVGYAASPSTGRARGFPKWLVGGR